MASNSSHALQETHNKGWALSHFVMESQGNGGQPFLLRFFWLRKPPGLPDHNRASNCGVALFCLCLGAASLTGDLSQFFKHMVAICGCVLPPTSRGGRRMELEPSYFSLLPELSLWLCWCGPDGLPASQELSVKQSGSLVKADEVNIEVYANWRIPSSPSKRAHNSHGTKGTRDGENLAPWCCAKPYWHRYQGVLHSLHVYILPDCALPRDLVTTQRNPCLSYLASRISFSLMPETCGAVFLLINWNKEHNPLPKQGPAYTHPTQAN